MRATLLTHFGLAALLAGGAAAQEASVADVTAEVRAGRRSALSLTEAALARAEQVSAHNAFITLAGAEARAAAARIDDAARSGAAPPLAGVPLVVKDNIHVAGLPNSAGTPALRDWRPAADAPVVRVLREAGAVILGKTNLHELAFGITSNNAAFGPVRAAYDPARFAGGSSGGTGVAVALGVAPAGLCTDTGGSCRIPAVLNGVAGFRPTVGRYPGEGVTPISATRDTVGVIARRMADIALLDAAIVRDPAPASPAEPSGIRLGVPRALYGDLDPATATVVEEALAKLRGAGITLVEVEMPGLGALAETVGFPVALHEARRDLAYYLARYHTGLSLEEVAARIASPDVRGVFAAAILGDKGVPRPVYEGVIRNERPKLLALYADTFATQRLDAVIYPATPLPAQPIEGSDETVGLNGRRVPTFPTFIRNLEPGSNAAVPSLALPAGFARPREPVGLALDAPAWSDRRLLAVGLTLERVLGRLPPP